MRIRATIAVPALAALAVAVACRAQGEAGGRVARAEAERIAMSRTAGLGVLETRAEGDGRTWLVEILVEKRGTRAEVEVDSATGRVVSVTTRNPPEPDDPLESSYDRQRPRGR